jgi:exodeoxyribonuclease VII large subunit
MAGRKDPFFSFDPSKARGPRRGPDVGRDVTDEVLGAAAGAPATSSAASAAPAAIGGAGSAEQVRPAMSVSALVARIKSALAESLPQRLTVVGEISNFKRHDSGHFYFRLKDAGSSIDAVMFRGSAGRVRFDVKDGLEVVVEGRVDVYEIRGQMQLYVERMTPKGAGSLELAFRQLKERLQREGLFDPAAKKPLVQFPRAIGVVSSATGAAIRDIRRTLGRRWPAATVYLVPTLVQGDGAAEQVAQAVRLLDANAARLRIDTIIVARGGGSLEDLWAFNEEVLARAVFAARTPIISGVGHEVDVTICDLVADVRAATPTAAAELAVPDRAAVADLLSGQQLRLHRHMRQRLAAARSAVDAVCRSGVFRDPTARLRTQMQRLDELWHRLRGGVRQRLAGGRQRLEPPANRLAALHPARLRERAAAGVDRLLARLAWALGGRSKRAGDVLGALAQRMTAADPAHRVRLARQNVDAAARQLEAMSYRNVLKRGFSVTRLQAGRILRSVAEVTAGAVVETELADGKFLSHTSGQGVASQAGEQGGQPAHPAEPPRPKRAKPADKAPLDGPTLFD